MLLHPTECNVYLSQLQVSTFVTKWETFQCQYMSQLQVSMNGHNFLFPPLSQSEKYFNVKKFQISALLWWTNKNIPKNGLNDVIWSITPRTEFKALWKLKLSKVSTVKRKPISEGNKNKISMV